MGDKRENVNVERENTVLWIRIKKISIKRIYQRILFFGRKPSNIPQQKACAKAPGFVFDESDFISVVNALIIINQV